MKAKDLILKIVEPYNWGTNTLFRFNPLTDISLIDLDGCNWSGDYYDEIARVEFRWKVADETLKFYIQWSDIRREFTWETVHVTYGTHMKYYIIECLNERSEDILKGAHAIHKNPKDYLKI